VGRGLPHAVLSVIVTSQPGTAPLPDPTAPLTRVGASGRPVGPDAPRITSSVPWSGQPRRSGPGTVLDRIRDEGDPGAHRGSSSLPSTRLGMPR
jgi:hypothetical protein